MRTLITRTTLMIASVFTILSTQARGPAFPMPDLNRSMERELNRQINKFVTYPLMETQRSMDGEVYVSFVIDLQGKVEVISANSNNMALRAYVLDKLSRVDIGDNPSGTWRTTHMKFVFHPEI